MRNQLSRQTTTLTATRSNPSAAIPVALAFVAAALTPRAWGAMWKELGHPDATVPDKVFLDMESIGQNGDYRQAVLMTVYGHPRLSANQLLLDRHNQTEAFDCAGKRISGILTAGFLQGQPVGRSVINPDWKTQFKDLPDDTFSKAAFDLVCSAQSVPKARPLPHEVTDSRSASIGSSPNGGIDSGVNGGTNGPMDNSASRRSSGTGLAVGAEGLILTNHHVVNGCSQLAVRTGDGQADTAALVADDPKNDLALLRSPLRFHDVARFRIGSRPAKLGEFIGVVGYPLTGFLSTDPKATFGEVTSVSGPGNDYTRLQISAPVQPGNSGSPVLDASGSVVGVVVAQAALAVATMSGNIPQNINFAIRGEVAQDFLRSHEVHIQTADDHDHLATEDVADKGQKIAVLIACRY